MKIVYIKFNTNADKVRGFYQLATKARVSSLPNGIYAVPVSSLHILDAQHISYRRATDEEVANAHGKIRNPFALILQ